MVQSVEDLSSQTYSGLGSGVVFGPPWICKNKPHRAMHWMLTVLKVQAFG